jgi:hypothetical protein
MTRTIKLRFKNKKVIATVNKFSLILFVARRREGEVGN